MFIFYHIYYNFYNLAKRNNSVLPPQFVALVCVLALEIWLIGGLLNELNFLFGVDLMPDSIYNLGTILGILTLVGINTYFFEYQDKGKISIKKIEHDKSKIKVRIAWFVAVAIIVNYWFVSLYLLSLKSQ